MKNLYKHYLNSIGVSTDTRTISEGSFFVALKGENFDANEMVDLALEKGAEHVVTSNKKYVGNPKVTVVDDTLKTLQQLAAYHREQLEIPIVGITGTNGKTTTKELVTAVLSKKYKVAATKGNLNNHIGVPLTLLSINSDHDIAVVEMGASHPGEIKELAVLVKPTSGLITNVGIAHIEGFGSFEGVKTTKRALYDQIAADNGTIFINIGNDNLVGMLPDNFNRLISYGTDVQNCLIDGQAIGDGEMLQLEWRYNNGIYHSISTNLTGVYNLENVLAAATVGCFYDVDEADICLALSEYKPTNSRSQVVQTNKNRIIIDAYNANPSSMMASLDNFQHLQHEHKVLILGAMRELGVAQDSEHLSLLKKISAVDYDEVYLVGNEFAKFAEQFPRYHYAEMAIDIKDEICKLSGKYILLKGSNSNKLSSLVEYL
ncbi:MAG: UDP-N-acetylmuramoyl-tripeptide--D-alanyl-D-alanine ligase [Marinilabiliaceae bacterium]|nr:UDP-N-acetylmuramoyl-tripeptide--D-alanyl-D-alanine ligase [Marinilabiliaceae bacterium]